MIGWRSWLHNANGVLVVDEMRSVCSIKCSSTRLRLENLALKWSTSGASNIIHHFARFYHLHENLRLQIAATVLNLVIAMLQNYYGPIFAGNVSKFGMLLPPRYLLASDRRPKRGDESRNTDVKSGTKRRKYQQPQSTSQLFVRRDAPQIWTSCLLSDTLLSCV